MIDRMRTSSERVEYWNIKLDHCKGKAEIEFIRPSGGRVQLSIPIEQLSELKADIERQYVEKTSPEAFAKKDPA